MKIRNRDKKPWRIKARELVRNPKNTHPSVQRRELQGLRDELNHANALPIRQLPDQRFLVVDGQSRRCVLELAFFGGHSG